MELKTQPTLSARDFKSIRKELPFSAEEWAGILNMSKSSYYQKWRKENSKSTMLPLHASLIFKIEEVSKFGIKVFNGEVDSYFEWLRTSNPSYNNIPPVEFLNNIQGVEYTLDILSSIYYGHPA